MAGPRVTLVDYGVGNLLSVRWALEAAGARVLQTADVESILASERVVLPGVGAFGRCMERLRQAGLTEALQAFSRSGRPLLGICVGMQLLLDTSSEFGVHEGLGLTHGTVERIPATGIDGRPHKIPHIGWTGIRRPKGAPPWDGTPLENTPDGTNFYFVHSYSATPSDVRNGLAVAFHGGQPISAAIRSGKTFGVQFHPEKSGPAGLQVIRTFVAL